jgi:peptidoglycan-associated lipoprotein
MSFSKIIGLGVLALGLAFSTTACGLFEPDEPEPGLQGADAGANADLSGAGPNSGANFNQNGGGAGDWAPPGKTVAGSMEDFGTPIPGLQLPVVYFAFDQARIGTSEIPKLEQIANYLQQHPGTGVIIEGNCDERGSAEYNRALGERRALAAKEFLASKGIDANTRMRTVSYGSEKPADPGHNEQAWSKNRRDEFIGVTLKNK